MGESLGLDRHQVKDLNPLSGSQTRGLVHSVLLYMDVQDGRQVEDLSQRDLIAY
jgi:hypothetical protein